MRNRHVLLFSGGLDSFIAYHWIKYYYGEPDLLYIALGHKYQDREIKAINKLTAQGVIPGAFVDHSLNLGDWEEPSANIPMRNSLLAHVAAKYGDNIWMIVQKGETNIPDRSPEFFEQLDTLLTHLNGRPIAIDSPFWHMSKVDMVKWYKDIAELPITDLINTTSCYEESPRNFPTAPCGKCSACFRRWVAFELNDIEEPYLVNPWETDLAQQYLKKGVIGFYGAGRDEEIIRALTKRGVTLNVN